MPIKYKNEFEQWTNGRGHGGKTGAGATRRLNAMFLTGMRFMGFSRKTCVFFSNILSVPVILGSLVYLIINDNLDFFFYNFNSLLIILLSTAFSIIFIHFFVSWVNRFSLFVFVLYRIIFGVFLIFFYASF